MATSEVEWDKLTFCLLHDNSKSLPLFIASNWLRVACSTAFAYSVRLLQVLVSTRRWRGTALLLCYNVARNLHYIRFNTKTYFSIFAFTFLLQNMFQISMQLLFVEICRCDYMQLPLWTHTRTRMYLRIKSCGNWLFIRFLLKFMERWYCNFLR